MQTTKLPTGEQFRPIIFQEREELLAKRIQETF
jgi:hypothetical protein